MVYVAAKRAKDEIQPVCSLDFLLHVFCVASKFRMEGVRADVALALHPRVAD